MIITFNEFKKKIPRLSFVYLCKFRGDEPHEFYGREVSASILGTVKSFFYLPLADNYKMDVYTTCYHDEFYADYVQEEAAIDFTSKSVYVVAPSFAQDVEKAYKRVNDAKNCSINAQILASVSVACATWMRRTDFLNGKNEVRLLFGFVVVDACEKNAKKRQKKVLHYVKLAQKGFANFLRKNGYSNEEEYMTCLAQEDKEKADAERDCVRATKYLNSHVFNDFGYAYTLGYETLLYSCIRTGKHCMYRTCSIGNENTITCHEEEPYACSRKFPRNRRGFHLTIKKGYNVQTVNGLITFYRGEFKHQGMACEWIEQGRAIADIVTKKGFLMNGRHIEAKTLKEASCIYAENFTNLSLDK